MLDVVPPPTGVGSRHPSRRRAPSRASQSGAKDASRSVSIGPRVVQLDWRLPARLRRPVATELDRQRRRQRQRQAIVQFERRPLITPTPVVINKSTVKPKRYASKSVYQPTTATVRTQMPPYAGSFIRQLSGSHSQQRPAAPNILATRTQGSQRVVVKPQARLRVPGARPVRARPVPGQTPPRVRQQTRVLIGERDVPFVWSQSAKPKTTTVPVSAAPAPATAAVVVQPKRRFALPLHFSIWPRNQETAIVSEAAPTRDRSEVTVLSKKKVQRAAVT